MRTSSCCRAVRKRRTSLPASPFRRGAEIAGAFVSAVTLIVMPKCPMCLAAYLALATGIGVSVSAASQLRTAILAASFLILIFLAMKYLIQIFPRHNRPPNRRLESRP